MSKLKRISGVILRYDDMVLLCQRSPDKSLPLEWSIPSGHIDKGEMPKEAAKREFKEETSIDLKCNLNLTGILSRYKNNEKKKIIFAYCGHTNKKLTPDLKKAKDGHEHTKCKYFKKNELPITDKNKKLMEIVVSTLK